MDCVYHSAGVLKAHPLTSAVSTTGPASVDKPDVTAVLLHLFSQHFRIHCGMECKESLTKAGRESSLRLCYPNLSASNLGSVSRDEVVHGLVGAQLGNRRENAKGIASEENDVPWVPSNAWDFGIAHVLNWVAQTRVLSELGVVEINGTCDW